MDMGFQIIHSDHNPNTTVFHCCVFIPEDFGVTGRRSVNPANVGNNRVIFVFDPSTAIIGGVSHRLLGQAQSSIPTVISVEGNHSGSRRRTLVKQFRGVVVIDNSGAGVDDTQIIRGDGQGQLLPIDHILGDRMSPAGCPGTDTTVKATIGLEEHMVFPSNFIINQPIGVVHLMPVGGKVVGRTVFLIVDGLLIKHLLNVDAIADRKARLWIPSYHLDGIIVLTQCYINRLAAGRSGISNAQHQTFCTFSCNIHRSCPIGNAAHVSVDIRIKLLVHLGAFHRNAGDLRLNDRIVVHIIEGSRCACGQNEAKLSSLKGGKVKDLLIKVK